MFKILLFAALTFPSLACGQSKEYKNEVYNYSIVFPSNWVINEDNNSEPSKIKAINSLPGKNSGYGEINIVVMNNVSSKMLKKLMEEDIAMANKVCKSFEIAQDHSIILNNKSAFVVELLVPIANHEKARILNYGIAEQGNLYFIRCFADETFFKKSGDLIRASCGTFKVGLH